MIGKKNIVFGFLFLVFTASLGPLMVVKYFPDVATAEAEKQQHVGALQQAANDGFEKDLEPMTAEQIAKANTRALLSLSARLNAEAPIDSIKGGPHAHGNLEALLNIVIGFLLCFLAIHPMFKQVISWTFILGTLFHSGLYFFAVGLEMPWAASLATSAFGYVGPVMILFGLLLAGVATILGFRGTLEGDY